MSTIDRYRWQQAPLGLATRRQLRAKGLRPGGQPVVAEIVWRRGQRFALLYREADALPVRPMTEGRRRAVAAMLRARSTCPDCGQLQAHVIPTSLGCCWSCSGEAAA